MENFNVYPVYEQELKRTWKPVSDKRILSIWNEVVEEAIKHDFLKSGSIPQLRSTNRLTSTVAFCSVHGTVDGVRSCVVLSDALLLQSDHFVRSIMCHEMGHAVCPVKVGHDLVWYIAAAAIGSKWGYVPSPTITPEQTLKFVKALATLRAKEATTYKYQLVCQKCGKKYQKYKTLAPSITRNKWACGHCHESLDVQDLETGAICWCNSKRNISYKKEAQ